MEYTVVMNHEEQYSIWPAHKPTPSGWNTVGVSGSEDECLDYIEKVWTDIRPKSLRDFLAQQRSTPQDSSTHK